MLLHKKRIQGNLNGMGYINPYSNGNLSILDVQPLCYNDYPNNLNLISEQYEDTKIIQIKDDYKQNSEDQSGSGIVETATAVNELYQAIKTIGSAAIDAYSSETGTKVKNYYGKYINPHPNWRPGYAGEKHMLHSSGNTYNFLGPHTNIDRWKRKDPPMDQLDSVAKNHDEKYFNAKNLKDIRKADIEFIKDANKTNVNRISKKIVTSSIKAKMKAEDLGLLDRNYFSQINIASNEDSNLVGKGMAPPLNKLKKVRKMGKYPDSNLRNKLIKQYAKSKKKLINKINA